MKSIPIIVALLVVGATGPAFAADFEYRGALVGPIAIPARPIVVPDCDDRRGLRAFRCVENRVYVDQNDEPWVDRMSVVSGYRIRPYQRFYQRTWGR